MSLLTPADLGGRRLPNRVVVAPPSPTSCTLGGRIVLQLWHTGAVSHPSFLGERPGGPSAVDPGEQAS